MKLLLDENLPPGLVRTLAGMFPDSAHVLDPGFGRATDETIYRFAGSNGFTIITKDDDFEFLSQHFGAPPKVVLLKIGNTTVTILREFLERHGAQIADSVQSADEHRLLKIGPAA